MVTATTPKTLVSYVSRSSATGSSVGRWGRSRLMPALLTDHDALRLLNVIGTQDLTALQLPFWTPYSSRELTRPWIMT